MGWLVVLARAVTRKTPIYFMIYTLTSELIIYILPSRQERNMCRYVLPETLLGAEADSLYHLHLDLCVYHLYLTIQATEKYSEVMHYCTPSLRWRWSLGARWRGT